MSSTARPEGCLGMSWRSTLSMCHRAHRSDGGIVVLGSERSLEEQWHCWWPPEKLCVWSGLQNQDS